MLSPVNMVIGDEKLMSKVNNGEFQADDSYCAAVGMDISAMGFYVKTKSVASEFVKTFIGCMEKREDIGGFTVKCKLNPKWGMIFDWIFYMTEESRHLYSDPKVHSMEAVLEKGNQGLVIRNNTTKIDIDKFNSQFGLKSLIGLYNYCSDLFKGNCSTVNLKEDLFVIIHFYSGSKTGMSYKKLITEKVTFATTKGIEIDYKGNPTIYNFASNTGYEKLKTSNKVVPCMLISLDNDSFNLQNSLDMKSKYFQSVASEFIKNAKNAYSAKLDGDARQIKTVNSVQVILPFTEQLEEGPVVEVICNASKDKNMAKQQYSILSEKVASYENVFGYRGFRFFDSAVTVKLLLGKFVNGRKYYILGIELTY